MINRLTIISYATPTIPMVTCSDDVIWAYLSEFFTV